MPNPKEWASRKSSSYYTSAINKMANEKVVFVFHMMGLGTGVVKGHISGDQQNV